MIEYTCKNSFIPDLDANDGLVPALKLYTHIYADASPFTSFKELLEFTYNYFLIPEAERDVNRRKRKRTFVPIDPANPPKDVFPDDIWKGIVHRFLSESETKQAEKIVTTLNEVFLNKRWVKEIYLHDLDVRTNKNKWIDFVRFSPGVFYNDKLKEKAAIMCFCMFLWTSAPSEQVVQLSWLASTALARPATGRGQISLQTYFIMRYMKTLQQNVSDLPEKLLPCLYTIEDKMSFFSMMSDQQYFNQKLIDPIIFAIQNDCTQYFGVLTGVPKPKVPLVLFRGVRNVYDDTDTLAKEGGIGIDTRTILVNQRLSAFTGNFRLALEAAVKGVIQNEYASQNLDPMYNIVEEEPEVTRCSEDKAENSNVVYVLLSPNVNPNDDNSLINMGGKFEEEELEVLLKPLSSVKLLGKRKFDEPYELTVIYLQLVSENILASDKMFRYASL